MIKNKGIFSNISHSVILGLVESGCHVLDLGCGAGELLKTLSLEKNVKGSGVEIDENQVIACLKKGLSVVHGNIDEGLKVYPDNSYDYVILNQTLQAVYNIEGLLKEMLRIGRKVIVGIPNFAHWRIRMAIFFRGRLPITRTLSSEWYNTPNIRIVTVKDFKTICNKLNIRICQKYFMANNKTLTPFGNLMPNLFCENALFVLEK
ncbi:MAG: methionine biosynthesis protein MetW [bacterium]